VGEMVKKVSGKFWMINYIFFAQKAKNGHDIFLG